VAVTGCAGGGRSAVSADIVVRGKSIISLTLP